MTDERPRGVQLRRTKGWRMPPNTVKVCRPSIFGNPFLAGVYGHDQAVALHAVWLLSETAEACGYSGRQAEWLNARRELVMGNLHLLCGKHLACWCAAPGPGERDCCHRRILLELANPCLSITRVPNEMPSSARSRSSRASMAQPGLPSW